MSNCSVIASLPQTFTTMSVCFGVHMHLGINDRSLNQALSHDSHVTPD